MPEKHPIRIDDLYKFRLPSEPCVSPDGQRVAFIVEQIDKKENEYYTNIHISDTNGRNKKQLTFGKRNDRSPSWSPDEQPLLLSASERQPARYGCCLWMVVNPGR